MGIILISDSESNINVQCKRRGRKNCTSWTAAAVGEMCNGKRNDWASKSSSSSSLPSSWDPDAVLPFCQLDHVLEILDTPHILKQLVFVCLRVYTVFLVKHCLRFLPMQKNNGRGFLIGRKIKI
ncbi:unnamed protein product [Macrosiphum euphorbiae]|uniref:Uncharacterized protein n=1 Tax=Macrosiphum euphorbiae TaxID=13131 RepID=A0AAV0VV65_9HEMI|nr:unnamed protein product [Macrosiphum euphorbiae]